MRRRAASGDSTVNNDSLIIGEGVKKGQENFEKSPFRLSTQIQENQKKVEDFEVENSQFSSLTSFSSIKSKIKSVVTDKYRKSSLKSKIQKKGDENLNKLRSHSHGALPSLDEFQNKNDESEDEDINGIWSASQLASKQAKEQKKVVSKQNTAQRPFANQVKKKFWIKSNLILHKLIHSKRKPNNRGDKQANK